MSFWFCTSCKKTWHSYIVSPGHVKKIRCFNCLKHTALKIKDDRLRQMDGNMTYDDYLWFKRNNGKVVKNSLKKKSVISK